VTKIPSRWSLFEEPEEEKATASTTAGASL